MSDFIFKDIVLGSGRKSAIGLVSMDSANISHLSFENISINGKEIATPLFLKLGNRQEGEDGKARKHPWPPGSITDVNFTDIRAPNWGHSHNSEGRRSSYTATIEGLNAQHRVGPVRLTRFSIVAPGGGKSGDAGINPPINAGSRFGSNKQTNLVAKCVVFGYACACLQCQSQTSTNRGMTENAQVGAGLCGTRMMFLSQTAASPSTRGNHISISQHNLAQSSDFLMCSCNSQCE